jgi:single-stranded-DNA-specific exonuclease
MDGAKEHFVGYGGHAAAAGFHFDPDNLAALHQALRQSAEQFPEPPPPTLDIDCEVQPQEITLKVMADLATLEPFGNGFARPLFLATDMKVQASPRLMTEGRHAALDLSKHGTGVRAVGFNMGERLQDLQAGDLCDVVFEPMVNDFRGRRSVEWRIQDFKTTQQC